MSQAAQRRPGGAGAEGRPLNGDSARTGLWAAALVVAIFLIYRPAWNAGFIWDDDAHLTAHPCIVGPLGFQEIWTTAEANYFPLVLTTFWVVNKIFGLNPVVFHLLGIALHAVSALLLWAVLRRLGVRGAFFGALLWALHPVAVESVAWVSEIINTQSCALFLLSIWFASRWLSPPDADPPRGTHYVLAVICGLGAILSKPSTVMLPVVLALCAWWLRGRLRVRDALWLAPFFFMAMAASGWTIWEQKIHQGAAGAEWNQSLAERIVIAGRVPWFYLGKLVWPESLSFIYRRWTIESGLLSYLPFAAVTAAVIVLVRRGQGTLRPVAFAALFFVAMLFPVLGFFSVYFFRFAFVADHFQYLASIGPLALAGAGLATLGEISPGRAIRLAARTLLAFLALAFAALSGRQAHYYRDDETLWRATLRTNPDAFLAHNNLGVTLLAAGRHAEAASHFEVVLRADPSLALTHFNLGKSLAALPGRQADARRELELAVELDPRLTAAHFALAGALTGDPGRRLDAIEHYEMALRLGSDNAEAHANLGLLLGADPQRISEAIEHGEKALQLKPASPEAHFNLANNLTRLPDRLPDAIAHYEEALRLKPDYTKAHINLGLLLARTPGRALEAVQHYAAALKLEPNSAITHNNLAIVLAESGRIDEAVAHLEQAVQIDPGYEAARNNLTQLKARRTPPP